MATDRLAMVTGWVSEAVRTLCLAQGWDGRDWEYSVTFRPVTIKGRAAVIWDILLTLDSGLVGQPHFEAVAQIPGGRPTMEQVAERVTHYMTLLWQGKLTRLGVKQQPGMAALPPPGGKLSNGRG